MMVQIHHKIGWLVYVCTSISQKIYVHAIMLHAIDILNTSCNTAGKEHSR